MLSRSSLLLSTTMAIASVCVITTAAGQSSQPRDQSSQAFGRSSDAWCADMSWDDRPSYCEVREERLPAVNPLEIDARPNGGIRVRGSDRGDALIRARIGGSADTRAAARSLVSGVRIVTLGASVHVEGPARSDDQNWQVSFELEVPRSALLTLTTTNGGIRVDDFHGGAKLHARNGGVRLSHVNGDISGETTNGGITVDLDGDRWDGAGLDIRTTNGGIRILIPRDYSAALDIATTHGRVNVDFPITIQGTISQISRRLETVIGAGGAKIAAVTTNGGVTIHQK
jgi:hypothetical protein